MLALSDHQLKQVQQAAALLPPAQRDHFERSVAGRLSAIAFPTDYDVSDAVNFVLGTRGVAVGQARHHKENTHVRR
jgi:hypothetical protein